MIQNYIVYHSLYLNYNESAKETAMFKKEELLRLFRKKAYEYSQTTILKISDYKKQTAEINNYIKDLRTNAISDIVNNYNKQNKYAKLLLFKFLNGCLYVHKFIRQYVHK